MGGGNPLKKIEKTVKTAASQTKAEAARGSEKLSRAASAGAAALGDPGNWTAFLASPLAGQAMGSESAVANYEALNEADKAEARAEAEMRMAQAEESKLMEEQKATEAKQSKMVKERSDKAAKAATERATRLGKGRRGLLYQGKETGVSDKLGG